MWKRFRGTCGRIQRSLGEYVDGTLPLPRRRAVEAHLRGCASCRHELEATRRTIALLADLPRRELSDGFEAALHARLATEAVDRETENQGRRWPFLIPHASSLMPASGYLRAPWPSPLRHLAPAGAAAALLLAVVAWHLQPVQPDSHSQPGPKPPPAYVATLVREHQMLSAGADLNATVVSHNVSGDLLDDGDVE